MLCSQEVDNPWRIQQRNQQPQKIVINIVIKQLRQAQVLWAAWSLPAALTQESERSVTSATFLVGQRGDQRTVDKRSQIVNYKTN